MKLRVVNRPEARVFLNVVKQFASAIGPEEMMQIPLSRIWIIRTQRHPVAQLARLLNQEFLLVVDAWTEQQYFVIGDRVFEETDQPVKGKREIVKTDEADVVMIRGLFGRLKAIEVIR